MLYVGIDIAKHDHVVGAIDERGRSCARPMSFKNSSSGFERLAAYLGGLAEDASGVAVGMEATGHYWLACFCFLEGRGFEVTVINPIRTDAMRRFKNLGKVKTDVVDCEVIADTLRCGDFEPSRLADEKVLSLRSLTRLRQSMTESAADLKRQVITALDQVFPEYEEMFADTFGETSKAFLKRCPTPEECMAVDIRTLTRLVERASHGKCGREKASSLKAAAKCSVGVTLASDAFSFQIKLLVQQIEFIEAQVAEVDGKVADLLSEVEPLILTIPGVSIKLGAQIVAEIGDVSRFKNASAVVKYAGICPSKNQSGAFDGQENKITKQGSPYLRRALYLAAAAQLKTKSPFYGYYLKKRGEGKAHREALVAVARKLVHVIYAVLSKQEPYDPDRASAASGKAL